MKNIKTVILKSGLELVGNVEEVPSLLGGSATPNYRIEKPFKIFQAPLLQQRGEGMHLQLLNQLVPALYTAIDPTLEVTYDDVLKVTDCIKQVEAEYIKKTTGLQLASA